ncbi:hypothetical protein V8C26DRAFT_406351 [Trichoderma gracile]
MRHEPKIRSLSHTFFFFSISSAAGLLRVLLLDPGIPTLVQTSFLSKRSPDRTHSHGKTPNKRCRSQKPPSTEPYNQKSV